MFIINGHEFYAKNMLGAYKKGLAAAKAGLPESSCPYGDISTDYKNGCTYSSAFRRYWHDGWKDGNKIKTEQGL